MKKEMGEYGGTVLRGFKGDGVNFIAGATLSPELVSSWPVANRMALHQSGHINWFGPPSEVEETTRKSGSPAPKRKTTETPEGAKVPVTPTRRKRQ